MPLESRWYKANTMVAELAGLRDQDGVYDNGATVEITAVVGELDGSVPGNLGLPITCAYKAASNGVYRGILPDDAGVLIGRHYLVTYGVTSGGLVGTWTERTYVEAREA